LTEVAVGLIDLEGVHSLTWAAQHLRESKSQKQIVVNISSHSTTRHVKMTQ